MGLVNLGTNLKITQFSAGALHFCAVLDNLSTTAVETSLKCWGAGSSGELGSQGTAHLGNGATEMGDNLSFVNIGTNIKITKLATGGAHNCIIFDNTSTTTIEGKVKCWGYNAYGQLGYEDASNRGDNNSSMGDNLTALDLGTNLKATDLILGRYHSCAILDNESTASVTEKLLKCWGRNNYGQLGQETALSRGDNASEMGDNLAFTELGDNHKIIKLAPGTNHTCAMLDNLNTSVVDNVVKCWGHNIRGGLGLGDVLNRGDNATEMGNNLPFVSLGTNIRVLDISMGQEHSCAIIDDTSTNLITERKLKCWGGSRYGELGYGNVTDKGDNSSEMGANLSYVDLGANIDILKLIVGFNHNCAILDNKSTYKVDSIIRCWGRNEFGQLGQGTALNRGDNSTEMGDNLTITGLGLGNRAIKDPPF